MIFVSVNLRCNASVYLSRAIRHVRVDWGKRGICASGQQRNRHRQPPPNDDETGEELTRKILKVAIVGVPNAGKSTLINQLVGRNVFAVSRKVHTTRCCARAVLMHDRTQVIFLDTPGLVTLNESEKHQLESSFLTHGEEAIKEADVVGVIHDVSNSFTRHRLSSKVLRLLHQYPTKRSFLIMNKVDAMKRKRDLLQLTDSLTSSQLPNMNNATWLTQSQFQEMIDKENGWPYFQSIFMVSALNGDGVGDIKIYLSSLAERGEWLFEPTAITDQNDVSVVEKVVFSKLLEYLPNVVPYNLQVILEYLNRSQDGSVTTVVLVGCKNLRMQKFVMGKGGGRMKSIARAVEQDLRKFFLNDVRVKLILVDKVELKKNDETNRRYSDHDHDLCTGLGN